MGILKTDLLTIKLGFNRVYSSDTRNLSVWSVLYIRKVRKREKFEGPWGTQNKREFIHFLGISDKMNPFSTLKSTTVKYIPKCEDDF